MGCSLGIRRLPEARFLRSLRQGASQPSFPASLRLHRLRQCLIVLRPSHTPCAQSQRMCAWRCDPSQTIRTQSASESRGGPFIIVRRYNQARIILTYLNRGPHQHVLAGLGPYRGRYRVAGQVPGSPSLICLSMPARSLRSRTRRAFARGPAALLDLRSARRPWGIRSGRRNDQSPIEQRNWETLVAQAGIAMAGSNGLPVFSTPKQITSSLRIAATTICLGLRRPACFRRSTSAMTAGL